MPGLKPLLFPSWITGLKFSAFTRRRFALLSVRLGYGLAFPLKPKEGLNGAPGIDFLPVISS